MDISQKKEALRKRLLKSRSEVPQGIYKRNSKLIKKKLLNQPEFKAAETIHCYVSMNDRGEVNTHSLLKEMLSIEKEVVVPVTNFDDGTLSHIRLSAFEDLEKNKWGVLEPTNRAQVATDILDLVIVPMVGGDEHCNRIGYGKGFYDRFLNSASCPAIGLLFEQNILSEVPVESFDVPLDKIITEQRVIRSPK